MRRKIISMFAVLTMVTAAINPAMPVGVFAENTDTLTSVDTIETDVVESGTDSEEAVDETSDETDSEEQTAEPTDSVDATETSEETAYIEEANYEQAELVEDIISDNENLSNIASGGVVLTPDESVLNDPVMTAENKEKLEAYKAKLTAEMEEEGYSLDDDYISLMSTDIPTFEQYLADYNYNFNCYSFYKNDFSLPYRSFVETKRDSWVYQSLLGAWRVATFDLSDFAKYSTKEIGFYETILFDVLYEGEDAESISGMMKDCVDTVQASTLKKVSDMMGKNIQETVVMNLSDISDDDFYALEESFNSCDELTEVFGAIGNVSKVLGYVDNVEELIYKLAQASVITKTSNEAAKILLKMESYTSNEAMLKALDNMILVCADSTSEAAVIAVFTSDMVSGELLEYLLGEIWDGVLDQISLYGFAVQAGQAMGKTLTHWLFSTDEDIEMYYSLCALYEFEDALKSAMGSFESSYTSSQSHSNSATFNECYKMLLNTYLFGAKASQEYVDIEYKQGLINELLFNFKEDEYDEYSTKLANLQRYIEQTLEFMDTIAYNGYLEEYCSDTADYVGAVEKADEYTDDEKQEIITLMSVESLETNNIEIEDNYTLTTDIHTYGSLTLSGGTLDLNGHTLTVDGNLLQTGGAININGGALNIGGDYEIAKVEYNGAGEKEYSSSDGYLNMTVDSDYISVGGDFVTYSSRSNTYNCLTAGTLELKGDFSQYTSSSTNFSASGTHTVIFSGTEQQNIYFDSTNSGFKNVEFENPNIKLNSGIRGFTLNDDIELELGVDYLYINGTLDLNGHSINSTDLYNGTLEFEYGTIDLCGQTINISGNLLQTGGAININGGALNIGGDYEIAKVEYNGAGEKEYSSSDGYLNMTVDSDYISVGGDFVTYSSRSNTYNCLTAGTLELKGDFSQYTSSSTNFSASGTHTVIFSGTEQQNIYFDSTSSGFNNLVISNTKAVSFTSSTAVKNELRQTGGASVINPDNVLLNGVSAFEDYGDLNTSINAYVGNAENVTPTYKDYEAYISHAEDPEYPYLIKSVSIKSTSGEELDSAPTNKDFIVNVDIAKQQSRDYKDYLFVAVYDTNGALLSINYVQAKFIENYTYSFGINIQKQSSPIGCVKAFVWNDFTSMQPLAESVTM